MAVKLLNNLAGAESTDLLRVVALTPQLHREIWHRFAGSLPPDEQLREYLVEQRTAGKFNPGRVDRFLRQFRETLLYSQTPQKRVRSAEPAETNVFSVPDGDISGQEEASDSAGIMFLKIPLSNKKMAAMRLQVPLSNDEFQRIVTTLANLKGALLQDDGTPSAATVATPPAVLRRTKPQRRLELTGAPASPPGSNVSETKSGHHQTIRRN